MKIIRHLLKPFLIFISFLTGFLHFLCIWKLFFCIDLCFVPLDVDFFKQTIVHSLHSICWIKRKTKNCCAVYSFMMDYQKLRIQLLKLYFLFLMMSGSGVSNGNGMQFITFYMNWLMANQFIRQTTV